MPTQNMSQNFNYLRWINSYREKINNVVIQKEVEVWLVKEYPPYDMHKNSVFKFQASANDIYLKNATEICVGQTDSSWLISYLETTGTWRYILVYFVFIINKIYTFTL